MKTIKVLCASCNTHLFNTDINRLDYPMSGDMFDIVFAGFFLRPIAINLDIFCPVCAAYPFYWDSSMPGAIGRNLNILDDNGKPQVLQIKQILMNDSREPAPLSQGESSEPVRNHIPVCENGGGGPEKPRQSESTSSRAGHGQSTFQEQHDRRAGGIDPKVLDGKKTIPGKKPVSAFPCPHCGAKKRFHKKGCTKLMGLPSVDIINQAMEEITPEIKKSYEAPSPFLDPHLLSMEARVSSGPERSETPTEQDLKDLERDRLERAREKPDPRIRPGEGFMPKRAR